MDATSEFFYPLAWRSARSHPGTHGSLLQGGTDDYAGLQPFIRNPHPRQIDVRASLADPLAQWMVRTYRQRSQIQVDALADWTASMSWTGRYDKRALVSKLVEMIARSCAREGDRFGFTAANAEMIDALTLPSRFYKGGLSDFCARLYGHAREGQSHLGLIDAARRLGRSRRLVFLISDFHWPDERILALMNALASHDVVPVVLWDPAEYQELPEFGLVTLTDSETGEQRRLLMRPALRRAILERFTARQATLSRLIGGAGRRPLFLRGDFVADDLTRYFMSGH